MILITGRLVAGHDGVLLLLFANIMCIVACQVTMPRMPLPSCEGILVIPWLQCHNRMGSSSIRMQCQATVTVLPTLPVLVAQSSLGVGSPRIVHPYMDSVYEDRRPVVTAPCSLVLSSIWKGYNSLLQVYFIQWEIIRTKSDWRQPVQTCWLGINTCMC